MTRHSVPDSSVRLPSTSPSSVVPCFLYGCTHRSSTRGIPRFFPRRIACTDFFCVCTHRCENNHPSHCFLSSSEVVLGDARPTTLFADSSQLTVVREPCESLLHIVSFCPRPVGLPVDKDDLINYQLLIIYQLLIRTFRDGVPTTPSPHCAFPTVPTPSDKGRFVVVRVSPFPLSWNPSFVSVSPHLVSHVLWKRRFSSTFPLPYSTLTLSPVEQVLVWPPPFLTPSPRSTVSW